jgi:hypothetical protein
MRIVELTPPQIVTLFGWFNLKPFITWEDIKKNSKITFHALRTAGLTPTQLHTIQPDIREWKEHGSITLHDCVTMTEWPAHPIHTMKADLADIISMRWSPEQMISLGITVDELIEIGMIPDLMTMFVFSLSSWVTIGLTRNHVNDMTDNQILRIFRMSRVQVNCGLPKIKDTTDTCLPKTEQKYIPDQLHLIRPIILK